eukprot:SAG31_NODE_1234_length_9204_cov_9.297748_7_plen_47_part_00
MDKMTEGLDAELGKEPTKKREREDETKEDFLRRMSDEVKKFQPRRY